MRNVANVEKSYPLGWQNSSYYWCDSRRLIYLSGPARGIYEGTTQGYLMKSADPVTPSCVPICVTYITVKFKHIIKFLTNATNKLLHYMFLSTGRPNFLDTSSIVIDKHYFADVFSQLRSIWSVVAGWWGRCLGGLLVTGSMPHL